MTSKKEKEGVPNGSLADLETALDEYTRTRGLLQEIFDVTTAAQSGSDEEISVALEKVSQLIEQSGLDGLDEEIIHRSTSHLNPKSAK